MWGLFGLTQLGQFIADEIKKRDMSARHSRSWFEVVHRQESKTRPGCQRARFL